MDSLKNRVILGIMSGSSLDGLDLAMVRFSEFKKTIGLSWELLYAHTRKYPEEITALLRDADPLDFCQKARLDRTYSHYVAEEVNQFIKESKQLPDYISSHGHTIGHYPNQGFSVQIGASVPLSFNTGIPVIADFRNQDMAKGGQGAPIVPAVEKWLFSGYDYYLNLGGICNLSIASLGVAFDVCPCNQVLNFLANMENMAYDEDGKLAEIGALDERLLNQLNRWEYYSERPPKSLDNHQIKSDFIARFFGASKNIQNALNTMCIHISNQVKKAVYYSAKEHKRSSMLITGGGAHNSFLIEYLENDLKSINIEVVKPDPMIIDYKEAILMALMGYLRLEGIPNCYASVTGAASDTVSGIIFNKGL